MSIPYRFDHLARMSDSRGLFEHALGTTPRTEHGYCTDDNARLLVVTTRAEDVGVAGRLGRLALAFVLDAQAVDGRSRNRMNHAGRWTDVADTEDCWGRGLWGLGATAANHIDFSMRDWSQRGFDQGVRQRSRWPRAMAFAALGAAEVVVNDPDHHDARQLLLDAVDAIGEVPAGSWSWPEPRLRYANAALAEAVIAAGNALDDSVILDRGLTMLGWLLDLETAPGHLSVVGSAGRGPGDTGPQFDQQPIEVAAMADACWRASVVTRDRSWLRGVEAAAQWFAGDNDNGQRMYDDESGGGFDGLQPSRVNINQGAESTLAFVSTMQLAESLAPL